MKVNNNIESSRDTQVLVQDLLSILSSIECYSFECKLSEKGNCVFLQVGSYVEDVKRPIKNLQWGRKFYMSPHMTTSEIVQTVFLAIKLFEEHELREHFTYKGVAVLGPHKDLENMVLLNGEIGEDARQHVELSK